MVRAAAKNHRHVGVVVDPGDYPAILRELKEEGALQDGTRFFPSPSRRSPTPPPTTRR